jgi:hypothetical protein
MDLGEATLSHAVLEILQYCCNREVHQFHFDQNLLQIAL